MVGSLDSTTYLDGSVERAFSWTWKQQWLNDALAIGVIDEGYERFNFSVCVCIILHLYTWKVIESLLIQACADPASQSVVIEFR